MSIWILRSDCSCIIVSFPAIGRHHYLRLSFYLQFHYSHWRKLFCMTGSSPLCSRRYSLHTLCIDLRSRFGRYHGTRRSKVENFLRNALLEKRRKIPEGIDRFSVISDHIILTFSMMENEPAGMDVSLCFGCFCGQLKNARGMCRRGMLRWKTPFRISQITQISGTVFCVIRVFLRYFFA